MPLETQLTQSDGQVPTDPPVPRAEEAPGDGNEPALHASVLAAAAAGDDRAWHTIVRAYGRRVFALVRSRLKRPDLAEEITQSVLATVATKMTTGDYAEQGRFEAWLFRIAVNRIRDEVRRQRRHGHVGDSEMLGDAPARPTASAGLPARQMELLRAQMAMLGEADREVIELRHHAGLTFAQIAELLDEPLGTLLARHHRALRKLRSMLEASGLDNPAGASCDRDEAESEPDGLIEDAGRRRREGLR